MHTHIQIDHLLLKNDSLVQRTEEVDSPSSLTAALG